MYEFELLTESLPWNWSINLISHVRSELFCMRLTQQGEAADLKGDDGTVCSLSHSSKISGFVHVPVVETAGRLI